MNAIFNLSEQFPPRVQCSLGDQLRRAALSIVNNIAEGSDKRSVKERSQFYRFALDSARERIPMFTICRDQEFITQAAHGILRDQCLEACRMLRGLIDAVER